MDEQKLKMQAEIIVDKIKELVKDGSASRVILKRKGETLLNLSLNTGIVGAVVGLHAAPFLVLTTALVSFGLDCEIEIEKKDGTVWNLNETPVGIRLEELKRSAKAAFNAGETQEKADVEIDPAETEE